MKALGRSCSGPLTKRLRAEHPSEDVWLALPDSTLHSHFPNALPGGIKGRAKRKRSTPFWYGRRLSNVRYFSRNNRKQPLQEPAHILITGRDAALLSTRGGVLETAGYRVTTTVSPIKCAEDLATVHLVVICHTLDAEQREHDLTVLRASSSQAKVLCLVPHAGQVDPQVAVLNSFSGPRQMLLTVKQCLAAS